MFLKIFILASVVAATAAGSCISCICQKVIIFFFAKVIVIYLGIWLQAHRMPHGRWKLELWLLSDQAPLLQRLVGLSK